jgi:ATP-dependent helicase/nuclease subunit A
MNLTPDQQRAIYTHDKNLIVVAGAGSGKTCVLVERYLALLDANTDWPLNALVAITFTRKAAQEMRDRVRQALEDRLHQASGDDVTIWSDRLAGMDSVRIDTIHGLCATILRANAAEAGIDPDFVVMDETDADILLETVMDDELARLMADDDPVLALFAEYDRRAINDVLRGMVRTSLPDLPDDWINHWQTVWESFAAECLARLQQNPVLMSALRWEPLFGWPEDDRIAEVWLACQPHLELLLGPDASFVSRFDALRQLSATIRLAGGSPKKWGGEDVLESAKEHLRTIRSVIQDALAQIGDPPGPLDEHAAKLLPLWARLIGRVQQAYDAAKRQQSLLDFDDLERRTCDLLVSSEQVRLRYRQAEFKHLLVDEFQDTNATQWDIAQALADPQQPGSLFVVGDQKQSIYAFRGADVSVFSDVRQQFALLGGAEVALARSFRTHQPLVDGFNAVFERILTRDTSGPASNYETDLGTRMDAQRQKPPGIRPPLEFLLVSKPEERRTEDMRRWEAYEIARRLHEMVEDNTPVYDRETGKIRRVHYGDMALLFQSMSHVTLYEEVFKALELPFVTLAGRGYYDRPEVWDLLNLLRALHSPADNLALASVLRSPMFGLSDDALLALRLVRDANGQSILLWEALSQPQVVPPDEVELATFARDCLYDLAMLAGRVTIAELLREALDRTGFLATLVGLPDGVRRRGNVEKLLAKAESSGKITLGAFEQYVRDLSTREVREGEAQTQVEGLVTLMTVHTSKGLEFPVVVLVDASWDWTRGNRDSAALMLDPVYGLCCKVYDPEAERLIPSFAYQQAEKLGKRRDEAERKRLLYVAATRAQDYLLVSGQVRQNKAGWKCDGWLDLLLDSLDLKPHLDIPGEQIIKCDWGQVCLNVQNTPPDDELMTPGERRTPSAWDKLQAGHVPLGIVTHLPLLDPVAVDRSAAARHLSVTQIAGLGDDEFESYYSERFRRVVLEGAPEYISPVPYPRSFKRLVGEMVHEALRWSQPDTEQLGDLLASYAWEQGIVDVSERQKAVQEALDLLDQYRGSELYRDIRAAKHLYRELPFIYDSGTRIIHGVIDTLFQKPDGKWVVVDYKTSTLRSGDAADAAWHVRRFHMQVGVYAAAVAEQLKVDAGQLDVYIHYVRYGLTVQVYPDEWQTALGKMEAYIGRLVEPVL